MRLSKVLFGVVIVFILGFFLVLIWSVIAGDLNHPEKEIVGTWKEVEWHYDKVDKLKGSSAIEKDNLKHELKNQISENLIIHESEKWIIKSDGTIELVKKNGEIEKVKWRLKGRGHILKLIHEDGNLEFYHIHKMSKDKLVLHFENDNHARGIVKIIFEKI
jgi:hypothetical protein